MPLACLFPEGSLVMQVSPIPTILAYFDNRFALHNKCPCLDELNDSISTMFTYIQHLEMSSLRTLRKHLERSSTASKCRQADYLQVTNVGIKNL
jgi:hypothetical protein